MKLVLGIFLGIGIGIGLGTSPSLGQPPSALVTVVASDSALSSDTVMPIYKPRKDSIPPARILSHAENTIDADDPQMPLYKPRRHNTPRARISGHNRGNEALAPSLIALVPDHVAFTIKQDTSLCWFLSRQTSQPVTLTVADSQRPLPILETRLPPLGRAGIHCVRLADYGVTLKEQEPYRWFITLVVNPERPSQDVVAGGMIERIPYDEACMLDMPCSSPSCDRAAVYRYAESGLWYDAITCLLDLIDRQGDDTMLARMLESLLQQSGIELPV